MTDPDRLVPGVMVRVLNIPPVGIMQHLTGKVGTIRDIYTPHSPSYLPQYGVVFVVNEREEGTYWFFAEEIAIVDTSP